VSEEKFIKLYSLDPNENRMDKHKITADFGRRICLSKDGNALVIATNDTKELIAYRITKKGNQRNLELVRTFPNKHPNLKDNIISLEMASNSKFLISCGSDDCLINVWSLRGELLTSLNTKQMKNHMACISPDSTMISAAAHLSDVRIWKVIVTKEGVLTGVADRAFTHLRGHSNLIHWVTFTSDSKRMLTTSKDKTWKLWDIDVNFQLDEAPKLITTQKHPQDGEYTRLAISSDDTYFAAITDNNTIHIWDLKSEKIVETIESAHYGPITDMAWFPKDPKLVTAGHDGYIRIFELK
jgi:WD40 repeat protein